MTRVLVPILLAASAIALFFMFTDPTYQKIKALRVQSKEYDESLAKVQDLRDKKEALANKYASIDGEDLAKLKRILPDGPDNIRQVIEISNLATKYNQKMIDLKIGDTMTSRADDKPTVVGEEPDTVGSIELGFSIEGGTYEQFLSFLRDLQKSERLAEVKVISFKESDGATKPAYEFNVKTFWLH